MPLIKGITWYMFHWPVCAMQFTFQSLKMVTELKHIQLYHLNIFLYVEGATYFYIARLLKTAFPFCNRTDMQIIVTCFNKQCNSLIYVLRIVFSFPSATAFLSISDSVSDCSLLLLICFVSFIIEPFCRVSK